MRYVTKAQLSAQRDAALAADRKLVAELSVRSELTPWEVGFVSSANRDVDAGLVLTIKQRDVAEGIARKLGVAVTPRK